MKVGISFRNEAHGKGAFFDHFTLRKMTGQETVIVKDTAASTVEFASYINSREGDPQKYTLPLRAGLPETLENFGETAGFIFIPGYTRDSDSKQPAEHRARLAFEKRLIEKARYRGQPVLAVCAGAWTLLDAYGIGVHEVDDHNYGGAMPRLSTQGARVCNNKMIHRVEIAESSHLAHAMRVNENPQVNSVHWKAASEGDFLEESQLAPAASSVRDDAIAPNSRQQAQMQPEDCVEAFETKRGVPMLGIQWHPEAFNPTDANAAPHQAIFNFMAKTANTYLNRRRVNQEFKDKLSSDLLRFFKQDKSESTGKDKPETDHKSLGVSA